MGLTHKILSVLSWLLNAIYAIGMYSLLAWGMFLTGKAIDSWADRMVFTYLQEKPSPVIMAEGKVSTTDITYITAFWDGEIPVHRFIGFNQHGTIKAEIYHDFCFDWGCYSCPPGDYPIATPFRMKKGDIPVCVDPVKTKLVWAHKDEDEK